MSAPAAGSAWSALGALERLRFWQGQTLRSLDFRDQARFDARRRRLHNRALHGTDGVSFGLAVARVTDDPTLVEVACGLAYECNGREVMLQRPRRIAAPAEPSWLMLRLRPTATPSSSCCTQPEPGCVPEDARLLERDAELLWDPVGSPNPVSGVVLAKFDDGTLDPAFRARQARALTRPRLARGQTVRGNTPWEPWIIDEPDGAGGLRQRVVGVETRIDTSAAGFTRTPCYFARLDSADWDLATSEFAPAFFPQVSDASVDGFTFKLLMVETARRRYRPSFGTARVTTTKRGVGERLELDVSDAGPLQKGDAIAQLRPHARSVVRVEAADGSELTLEAALGEVEADETMLAVGNLPRVTKVMGVKPESEAMLAPFTSPRAVKKADVLLRTTDNAVAVVDSVRLGTMTVGQPFANWKKEDPVSVARQSGAVLVDAAVTSSDGTKTSLKLKPATHAINAADTIVLLDGQKAPIRVVTVNHRDTATVEVATLTPAQIAAVKRVAPFAADVSIQKVEPKTPGTVVTVSRIDPFEVGDVVMIGGNRASVATIEKITAGVKEITLSAVVPVPSGESLMVAVNWVGATTVSSVGTSNPAIVVVGRVNAVPDGAVVARREADDFSPPVAVKGVNGAEVTLGSAIPGLARLDTLAIGVFPAVATVLALPASEEQFQIVEAGAFAAGQTVLALSGTASALPVARVTSVSGNTVVVGESLGALTAGQHVAVVNFNDRVLLTEVDAADPTKIEVDRDIAFREGDVVGTVMHYVDCSNAGVVENVQGNHITLGIPGIEHGDGIVDQGWIDGGIVGAAAVSFLSEEESNFPSQFQPIVRLDEVDGLNQPQPAVAHGLDLLSGRPVSSQVLPLLYDAAGHHVAFLPRDLNHPYRYRPETLSLITTFNTDFPRAFATFAQKQNLSVSWFGCQQESPPPSGCPGQTDDDPCADCRET